VRETHFASYDPSKDLRVPVYNRFDHTNLKELQFQVTSKGATRSIAAPDIPPHDTGSLIVPRDLLSGKQIRLRILQGTMVVDEELLTFGIDQKPSRPAAKRIRVTESQTSIEAVGDGFRLTINKKSGLIENGLVNGEGEA
jgi:beta-galactosidase